MKHTGIILLALSALLFLGAPSIVNHSSDRPNTYASPGVWATISGWIGSRFD